MNFGPVKACIGEANVFYRQKFTRNDEFFFWNGCIDSLFSETDVDGAMHYSDL